MIAAAIEELKEEWMGDAAATIDALANDLPEFTADDFRRDMRQPPVANWAGLAFTQAKREGRIESVSSTVSKARSRNSGSLKTWRRASKGATS